MSDIDKTIAPRRESVSSGADDVTMPGKRDRKSNGRFAVGDLIMGRYKVLAELGQGGMGVVYKCLDETAGIEVALKALPPELSHNTLEMEDIKENFQLVHNLHHPNIASSNTLEKDKSNGNYYLIMECCEGEDLRHWLRRKRKEGELKLEDVLPIVKQVAEALDYAHEMKIMHRDIKPGNIMINNLGKIKVLDFGLAAQIHTSMTRVSMAYHGTSGTGPYMAPEQWEGRIQDAKADQYALAVMTYEMLAGHTPFESTDAAVLREAVLKSKVIPLENISSSANAAIMRALSKEPAGRFENCSDFAAALGGKKIKAGKTVKKGNSGKWIAAALVIILLGGIGFYFSGKGKQNPTMPPAPVAPAPEPAPIVAPKLIPTPPQNPEGEREIDEKIQQTYRLQASVLSKKREIESANHDPGQRFGNYLKELKVNYEAGELALKNNDVTAANSSFQAADKAADWLIANAPLRVEVQTLRREVEAKKKQADKFDAGKLSSGIYNKASQQVKTAENAYESGNFQTAITALKASSVNFEKASIASHERFLKNLLSDAEVAMNNKQWDKIKDIAAKIRLQDPEQAEKVLSQSEKLQLAEKVVKHVQRAKAAKTAKKWDVARDLIKEALELDKENHEALKLSIEIEANLKTALRIKALVDGKEVCAEVFIGKNRFTTEQIFNDLENSKEYRCFLICKLEQQEYFGELTFQFNWEGLQTFNVDLEDRKTLLASDRKLGIEFSEDGRTLKKYPKYLKNSKYKIPAGVHKIAAKAFFNCDNLQEIALSDTVKIIGESAFGNCDNLRHVKLGRMVQNIGKRAFSHCKLLNNVEIAASISQIGVEAFIGCQGQKSAFEWFAKADQNDAAVLYNTAICCFSGNGTDIDTKRGMELINRAVQANSIDAKVILAKSCLTGKTWIDVDDNGAIQKRNHKNINKKVALQWLTEAISGGINDVAYELGMLYWQGAEGIPMNKDLAIKYLTKAAAQNHVLANVQLGLCYEHGSGVTQDIAKAKQYYQSAVNSSSAEAAFRLAVCFEKEKSLPEAFKWYLKAAEKDHVMAQYAVGLFYQRGWGVQKDEKTAAEYLKKAADAGYSWGQFSYALCCEFGKGVPEDSAEAVKYYELAAKQNHQFSIERLQKLNNN